MVANAAYPDEQSSLSYFGACLGVLSDLGFWAAVKILVKSGLEVNIRELR